MAPRPPRHVAYLVSAYPAVSHTFIRREIAALRARGMSVSTFSIRRAPDDQVLSADDVAEAARTFAVLPVHLSRLIVSHAIAVTRRPGSYVATLRRALGMSAGGARADLWQLFYFVEAIVVWHEVRRRGIRHIHAHFANVACSVALLAAEFGAPDGFAWSFTMHGPTEFDDVTAYALAEKVRSAAFVACISDFCRSQLMKIADPEDWDKLSIVRCGLPIGEPVAPAARDDGALRVLCVGRLVPEKGQLILARAVATLRDRGIDAHVTFVGDGPALGRLRAEITTLGLGDAAVTTGALGSDPVAELYRRADVFCLPSFAEGVPVVLMEAMAAGLPVLSTRIAGIGELVQDGVNGTLVAPGRPEPIAEALAGLAEDPERAQRWGAAGRERVARAFDVATAARLLEELFAARGSVGAA